MDKAGDVCTGYRMAHSMGGCHKCLEGEPDANCATAHETPPRLMQGMIPACAILTCKDRACILFNVSDDHVQRRGAARMCLIGI
jgi:hypothetical protein